MFSNKMRTKEILDSTVKDYIIIDEVSMMKEIFYKMMAVIRRFKPDVKFILCGHFEQFKPVKDRVGNKKTPYYRDSNIFHELCGSNMLELTTCRRSSKKHFDLVSNYKNVTRSDYNNKFADFHILFTTNKRIEVNHIMMEKERARINKQKDKKM